MALCAACQKPLTMDIPWDSDSDEDANGEDVHMASSSSHHSTTQTIPDDVHLPCNCHFHWECLLDRYEAPQCPHCQRGLVASAGPARPEHLLVDLHNEGGKQEQLDILPILQEERYLRTHPGERKSRAFLEFCREGDHRAVAELLKSCSEVPDEDDEDDDDDDGPTGPAQTADEILRYQDPLADRQSGLHAAVANGNREVAWLLLLLASEYPELEFPALVFQEAAALGIMREDQTGKVDIRSLRDAEGRSAEDVARAAGVVWTGWVGVGRLSMP